MEKITFSKYQQIALTTMKKFESPEEMLLNAGTGIAGESGELFDCVKKLYTHSLDEERTMKIKEMMKKEVGDIIWYIAAPLASYYSFSMEEVLNEIIKNQERFMEQKNFENMPISIVDELVDKGEYFDLKVEWKTIYRITFLLGTADCKEEIINYSALLIIALAKMLNLVLFDTLENIIEMNIEKIKSLYPQGFSSTTTSARVTSLAKHLETTDYTAQNPS